jgi:hypothetical protein
MSRLGEARPGQSCGKGAASLARHGSVVVAWRAHIGQGWIRAGEGDLVAGRSEPVWALSFGTAHRQASSAR